MINVTRGLMKGSAPCRMLISGFMLVMLTSLAGYSTPSGARGELDADLQPVEKAAPGIWAKTKDFPSKGEDEVMSKGENGQYNGAWINGCP